MKKQHLKNYCHLRNLQGQQIPVYLGVFKPHIAYWYHSKLMIQMMILSWSRMWFQNVIDNENSSFFNRGRNKALAMLGSHGVVHGDGEWHDMLWNKHNKTFGGLDAQEASYASQNIS